MFSVNLDTMKSMDYRSILARALVVLGNVGMIIGALDPMEGSAVILPGSGLVVLGAWLGHAERRLIAYRAWVFILVAIGVGSMFGLSNAGGIGGHSGRSMWWGMLILPYLVGWSMGVWGPGSPRWMLWLGMAVNLWYLALAVIIQIHPNPGHKDPTMSIVLGSLAALTIVGCISRLKKHLPVKNID